MLLFTEMLHQEFPDSREAKIANKVTVINVSRNFAASFPQNFDFNLRVLVTFI